MSDHNRHVTLNNGVQMPILGFGVFQIPPDQTEQAVTDALAAGYRHLDTAESYRNEEAVGRAIATSGIPRDELFVTTKLWVQDAGYERAQKAFDRSLQRLGLDYLDLYLIHWPVPRQDKYADAWRALCSLAGDGRVRAIGVSNFTQAHLTRIIEDSGVVPAVNQVELHPRFAQAPLRAFDAGHGIATEAWSPLGQGKGLLDDPVLAKIAAAHGRTPAQVVLDRKSVV